jgi:carboxymethylenebutenolidase
VQETSIEIRTSDGTSDSILYCPHQGQLPGVIFLTDIVGIRPSQRGMARRIADEGYTVLLPNIFYRTGRAPMFDFPPNFGEERTTRRLGELSGPLTPEAMDRDAAEYVDFLAAQGSVSREGMGVVGFCFAGGFAVRMAAVRPHRIAAAASFHGGRLYTDNASSPHRVLARVKAHLYFGHAVEDRSMPAEAIANLNEALKAWGGAYESEVYEGAHHGWTVPDNPAYNQPQAERAFSKLMGLFKDNLK